MNSTFIDFDKLYSQTCDNLRESKQTEEVLKSLKTASSDWDRVQLILRHNPDVVKLFRSNVTESFDPKDACKSKEFLKTACSKKSLDLINQALCLCPFVNDLKFRLSPRDIRSPSTLTMFLEHEPRSTASGNRSSPISEIFEERSKIFYEKGSFDSCLRDIIRSIDFGHDKTYDMTFRMGMCYKNLGLLKEGKSVLQHALQLLRLSPLDNEFKSKETINLVNLIKGIKKLEESKINSAEINPQHLILDHLDVYGGLNPILIGSSNAIELRFSEERGRHVLTTRTIPPGSTLIVESPYAWSVSPQECNVHCLFCLERTINGIPCPGCSSVMFCSEACFKKATEVLNPHECKILKLLDSSEKLGSMALLCFRTIAQTSLSVVKEEFQKSRTGNPPLETILGFNENGQLDSSNYSSVFAQTTNTLSRNAGDLLKRTYAAIYLTICLEYIGYFGDADLRDQNQEQPRLSDDKQIVSAVLLRHLQSASCNGYGVNYVSDPVQSEPLEIDEIGGATYPIISTTNHSCSPNAYRFNIGKTCVVKSLREIPEGEEVLDSYGPLHTISPLEQRLEELEKQYLFRCTCEGCVNDWPTFAELKGPTYANIYKCPNCLIGKFEGPSCSGSGGRESKDSSKRKCMGCGKVTDFKKVQKLLKTAQDKYMLAKEAVLQQKNHSLDVEKWICNYILTIQKVLITPCKEMVEAQEVLKLHWNLWVRSGRFPPV